MSLSKKTDSSAAPKPSHYSLKLDDAQATKLKAWCEDRGWVAREVDHAQFSFKGSDVNVTVYHTRKCTIMGKGTENFVTMTLEPEITGEALLGNDEVIHPDWFEPHAGLDESGKGDFYGPLVAATVIADTPAIRKLIAAGVKDSKMIADARILQLDQIVRSTKGVTWEVFALGMAKYNELMDRPGANMNRLLAWQHAVALIKALQRQPVAQGLLDQFSAKPLVQQELKRKGVEDFVLAMRTKAESDPVVAAASIVARAEYVRIMRQLSRNSGITLQKGASAAVKMQAAQIMDEDADGAQALKNYAKLHFRTAYEVVQAEGRLHELPLPIPKGKSF